MAATSAVARLLQCWDCGAHSSSPPLPSWHRHSCAAGQPPLPAWVNRLSEVPTSNAQDFPSAALLKTASVPESVASTPPPSSASPHHGPQPSPVGAPPCNSSSPGDGGPGSASAHTWQCAARWRWGRPELPQAKNGTDVGDRHRAISWKWKSTVCCDRINIHGVRFKDTHTKPISEMDTDTQPIMTLCVKSFFYTFKYARKKLFPFQCRCMHVSTETLLQEKYAMPSFRGKYPRAPRFHSNNRQECELKYGS